MVESTMAEPARSTSRRGDKEEEDKEGRRRRRSSQRSTPKEENEKKKRRRRSNSREKSKTKKRRKTRSQRRESVSKGEEPCNSIVVRYAKETTSYETTSKAPMRPPPVGYQETAPYEVPVRPHPLDIAAMVYRNPMRPPPMRPPMRPPPMRPAMRPPLMRPPLPMGQMLMRPPPARPPFYEAELYEAAYERQWWDGVGSWSW